MEQTPNKSQHRKLTLEKKILPLLLLGLNLSIMSVALYQQAIPASTYLHRAIKMPPMSQMTAVHLQHQIPDPYLLRAARCCPG